MADPTKPVASPVEIPFWSIREGFIARQCKRCGHRGIFLFTENPIMVSDNVVCLSCGSITFELMTGDVAGASVEEILEEGQKDAESKIDSVS